MLVYLAQKLRVTVVPAVTPHPTPGLRTRPPTAPGQGVPPAVPSVRRRAPGPEDAEPRCRVHASCC